MSSVGHIYTNSTSNKQYKCIASITISPTLMNKRETKSGVWKQILAIGDENGEAPKTIILEDEDGNQVVAVLVDEEVFFNATADDIREGKTAVTDDGVTVGEKFIPTYLATQGSKFILPGRSFSVKLADYDLYDYTKFQAAICLYDSSMAKSVSCEKVAINDNLYEVLSTVSLSEIHLDHDNKIIELGLTNESDSSYLIRFFTLKEVS